MRILCRVETSLVEQTTQVPYPTAPRCCLATCLETAGTLSQLSEETATCTDISIPNSTVSCRPYLGSEEMIQGKLSWCVWIEDQDVRTSPTNTRIWAK